jgi:putative ABC transport system ATP-binding protein
MKASPIVQLVGVSRQFGDLQVLQGLDLDVLPGELVALYGPSGSGKTTLLNLIGALDQATAGQVQVLGHDLAKLREGRRAKLRRREIGFIFQNYTLLPTYTAQENIDLALRLPGLGWWERRKRIKSTLEAVGLSAWADHLPDELSGGQRQRVAIARALALRPRLILADEPTSGLDSSMARRMMTLFRAIAESQGTSFVVVSHDAMIADYVDTTYDLHGGQAVRRRAAQVLKDAILKGLGA